MQRWNSFFSDSVVCLLEIERIEEEKIADATMPLLNAV